MKLEFISGRRFLQAASMAIVIAAMSQSGIYAQEKALSDRYNGLNTEKYLGKVNVETRITDTRQSAYSFGHIL